MGETPASDFPFDINISLDTKFISVNYYNGNADVFQIPDINSNKDLSNENVPSNPIQQGKITNMSGPPVLKTIESAGLLSNRNNVWTSVIDVQPSEITEVFYRIELKAPEKAETYDDLFNKFTKKGN
jgi:hypothetical protein